MNQRLPLGARDCASNSPRQISHASLPPTHSNEGWAPGSPRGPCWLPPSSAGHLPVRSKPLGKPESPETANAMDKVISPQASSYLEFPGLQVPHSRQASKA